MVCYPGIAYFMDKKDFYIVGIGASAGSFEVILDFFSRVPENPNAAFVLIRHLPLGYLSNSREIIARHTRLNICNVADQQPVNKGCLYILEGNSWMTIENNQLCLTARGTHEIINHAVDIFFASLAKNSDGHAIGVILSGAGNDGAGGGRQIHQGGGRVLVQEPASAEFKRMPHVPWIKRNDRYIN